MSGLFDINFVKEKIIPDSAIVILVMVLFPSKSYPQLSNDTTKFLGNIISGKSVPSKFDTYWNRVTPENAGKWGSVASSQDTNQWNWSTLDYIYNYAVSKGYPFKFHNLVWGNQQPSWITNLDPAEQRPALKWLGTYVKNSGDAN